MQNRVVLIEKVIIIVLAVGLIILANSQIINFLSHPEQKLTPDNQNFSLTDNTQTLIKGTIDPYRIIEDKDNENVVYVGLKEYGNKIIVKTTKDKINNNVQTFEGRGINITNLNNYANLLSELNSSLGNNSDLNSKFNLDPAVKKQIDDLSKGTFGTQSYLILDNEQISSQVLAINLLVSGICIFLAFILAFRRELKKIAKKIFIDKL